MLGGGLVYGSSYLLTTCAFQLFFGKLYTFFSIKWVYLSAIAVFELGSLICGAAPTFIALIVGRAIAGVGSAGIFAGALVIVAYNVPLRHQPIYTGILWAVPLQTTFPGGGVSTSIYRSDLSQWLELPSSLSLPNAKSRHRSVSKHGPGSLILLVPRSFFLLSFVLCLLSNGVPLTCLVKWQVLFRCT